ncbi:MAG TPA: adenylate/guanylate cyclase domain-containing protein [Thermoanaerobaculia bacterium]|nr:adenylate/guanylate cyclase domain-containing protein [Thermoanaerobaculia bacterium]
MALQLRFSIRDEEKVFPLESGPIHVGRGSENELVLPDFSVSRRHAELREHDGEWFVRDLDSTNGVQLNRVPIREERIRADDSLKIGIFELAVERQPAREAPRRLDSTSSIPNATIIRKLSEFSLELGLSESQPPVEDETKTEEPAAAAAGSLDAQFFRYLNRLARDLLRADTADGVLVKVMDIAFEALPVDRCFILVGENIDEVRCQLARIGAEVQVRPSNVPVSHTILQAVMEEQVALLTFDALDDHRLLGGESIRLHGIRAAMCAPLWSGQQIIGFIQVDTPFHTGSFSEQHLDFLITLANYAAVGLQRLEERRVRSRLERYHAPAVLEELLREGREMTDAGQRELRKGEVTILFCDLVGFTAFSESATLDEVAELLSGYCERSVDAIFAEDGTLDKFIGDCVMAFFGAPRQQLDHAERGVRAALRIQEAVEAWNRDRIAQGLHEVRCRIGLNSGPVVVGDVGSAQRVDYTVLGNAVNVAARLESSVAKPGQVVIGEATRAMLGEDFELEPLGELALKGLQQKVNAYRVLRGPEQKAALASESR